MLRATILATMLALPLVATAQAPIERRVPASLPSAPAPATPAQAAADRDWERLIRWSRRGYNQELRIQAQHDLILCNVDGVTDTDLSCTEHRNGPSFLADILIPRQHYSIPRADVLEVRQGGRDLSTLAGVGIGIGAGVAVGSISAQSRSGGGQAVGAIAFGIIGGFIGHAIPFRGHVIYRTP